MFRVGHFILPPHIWPLRRSRTPKGGGGHKRGVGIRNPPLQGGDLIFWGGRFIISPRFMWPPWMISRPGRPIFLFWPLYFVLDTIYDPPV